MNTQQAAGAAEKSLIAALTFIGIAVEHLDNAGTYASQVGDRLLTGQVQEGWACLTRARVHIDAAKGLSGSIARGKKSVVR
jgi:hypothetical protein